MTSFAVALCRNAILLLAVGASNLSANPALGSTVRPAPPVIGYAVGGGQLIAFDARSGQILRRLGVSPSSGFASPDLLVDRATSGLYLLGATIGSTSSPPMEVLSLVDSATWKVLRRRDLPYRLVYKMSGFAIMALSTDGSRLFVYSSDSFPLSPSPHPQFWLTVVDARTLRPLRTSIALPECGPGELAAVPGQIVVLCHGADLSLRNQAPSDLRFVNVRRLTVTARIRMSEQSCGLVVSPNQKYVYVGGFHVAEIDVSHHRVRRDVDFMRVSGSANLHPTVQQFDITSDGKRLILGPLASVPDAPASVPDAPASYAMQAYALPGLRPLPPVSLPFPHFVAAPGNKLITFSMSDSPSHDWQVALLDLQTGRSRPLFAMNGSVLRLTVSRT